MAASGEVYLIPVLLHEEGDSGGTVGDGKGHGGFPDPVREGWHGRAGRPTELFA